MIKSTKKVPPLKLFFCYPCLFSVKQPYPDFILAMRKEKQIQGTSQRQRQEACYSSVVDKYPKQQADLSLKMQTNLLKKQDEIVQKQQDALESPKVTTSFTENNILYVWISIFYSTK